MADSLRILLLGPPELVLGRAPVRIRSAKTRALLWHLAAARAPRSRAELAGLLWGERPEPNARGSLRLAISELRREVGDWLDVSRDQVALRTERACFVDHALLTSGADVDQALRLWRGDFLDGVAIDDAPAFSAWVSAERQRVRMVLRQVLLGRTARPDAQVVRLAHLLTSLDPLDEEAHRLLITSLARTGNRAAALACYDTLRVRLADELGVEPGPELRGAREEIVCVSRTPGRAGPVARGGGVPVPRTSLVGREEEVSRVLGLLDGGRMVSLLGPGGAGKTRLAIAVAHHWSQAASGRRGEVARGREGVASGRPSEVARGREGVASGRPSEVAFVSFAGVHAEAAVTTAARRLGVDLSPSRPAEDVLVAALSSRSVLLVLDNLEHLPGFDQVVGRILRQAPGVRVLATSRRRLAVPEHAALAVSGLPGEAAEALFVQRARAVLPGFGSDEEPALVSAVCEAVQGLPLAIELAAGLLRALPLDEVARRLGADLDLLAAPEPAPRPRHGTLRGVFETSWRLLQPAEQQALARASVFRGGFTLAAALDVTQATTRSLVRLVDHSMLQLDPTGRYQLHPIIQQYARAHLCPADTAVVRERHGEYFARLLAGHAEALQDGSDHAAIRVISAELDNIRAAWSSRGPDAAFLDRYWTACLRLRHYEEAVAVALRHLDQPAQAVPPWLRARWQRLAGTALYQLAREPEAVQRACSALETLGRPLPSSRGGMAGAVAAATTRELWRHLRSMAASGTGSPAGPARSVVPPGPGRPDGHARSVVGREAAAEEAQAASLLALLAYRRHDLATMLVAALRQIEAARRSGEASLRAETFSNLATILRIAGRRRLSEHFGTLADAELARFAAGGGDAVMRARLARGLDHLSTGRLEEARLAFAEARRCSVDPRLVESCAGMLAETAVWQGDFGAACELYSLTEELAAQRVGDDLGRYWCLTGRAEALLRFGSAQPYEVSRVLDAARASTERRRRIGARFGLQDDPAAQRIQRLRLTALSARLHFAKGGHDQAREGLGQALELAGGLPRAQPGMLECWSGLAELSWELWTLTGARHPRRKALASHLAGFTARNPGAAARLGWAAALLHLADGDQEVADRRARQALAAALRLNATYDAGRARRLLRHH